MEKESGSPSIEVLPTTIDQRSVLENLIQFYVYAFTEYVKVPLDPTGRFEYSQLPLYWIDPNRYPFIISIEERLAGFALVKNCSEFSENPAVWDMAEFFVMRGERGRGVGHAAAQQIWQRLSGPWEVRVLPTNCRALRFWRESIARFLKRPVEPVHWKRGEESRDLFWFESPAWFVVRLSAFRQHISSIGCGLSACSRIAPE